MKLIKSIVRPNKVDEVKDALAKLNIAGMTVTEVRGHGKQKGHTAIYRGKEYNVSLLPKMEIEVVVADAVADDVVKAIVTAARTGEIGDGRVFVLPVLESYRIRRAKGEGKERFSDVGTASRCPGPAGAGPHAAPLLQAAAPRRIEARAHRRHHPEEDPDAGREAEADRERPPGQRDRSRWPASPTDRSRCRTDPRIPPIEVSTAASDRNWNRIS